MANKDKAVLALSYLQGYLDDAVRIAKHRKEWECYTDVDNAVNEAVYWELAAVRDALYAIYLNDDAYKIKDWTGRKVAFARSFERSLTDVPTADVVEVIRCKDCKWFGKAGCAINIVDDSDRPKETDYCSYGERAEA